MILRRIFIKILQRKNGRVWYEYERYVRENIDEHKHHRFKHLIILFKLNWFYRIKKGNTPYLYWDVPLDPVLPSNIKANNDEQNVNSIKNLNVNNAMNRKIENTQKIVGQIPIRKTYCESQKIPTSLAVHLAKSFAKYDYIVLNVFDTLIYSYFNNKENLYDLLGQELGIPMFGYIRKKAEEEVLGNAKINGLSNNINIWDVYKEVERYVDIDRAQGVEAEINLLVNLSKANPYIKSIYDMVSYKASNIILVEDTIYTKEQVEKILIKNGIVGYQKLYLSNEYSKSISDKTMFEMLCDELEPQNVLYIDANRKRQQSVECLGWDIWEYREIRDFGNTFKIDGMSEFMSDIYSSIVAQRMYCGHFIHSIQYEVGFIYYGIFVVGYLEWVKAQVKKHAIDNVLFLEETGELLNKCYAQINSEREKNDNILWATEDFAVKILADKYPIFFYEHFIKRYISVSKPVSFYMEKMGLLELSNKLKNYGLTLSDPISRDSMFYGAFIDFIEDNFEEIKASCTREKEALCKYLATLNLKTNGHIAIVDVTGKGYMALALELILNEELKMNCKVKEFSAFQTIKAEDYLYNNVVYSYINAENIRIGDVRIIDNEVIRSRTNNILTNIAPIFRRLTINENGEIEFVYEGVYPWKYDNMRASQQGIVEFVNEYIGVFKKCNVSYNILPEDALRVLNHLFKKGDYVAKAFTIIRS